MRGFDFSSWQAVLSTLLGLAIITLLGVGIRLLLMQTVQQRRERENRQINERLRTLIGAYKTLGGSFTGDLSVDPTHLRDVRLRAAAANGATIPAVIGPERTDRSRRVRDTVEAALSDVILLGTEEQVRLAAHAATELAGGRPIHTAALVASLRSFIRSVLDLDPIAADVVIPQQGPARPGPRRPAGVKRVMAHEVVAARPAAAIWPRALAQDSGSVSAVVWLPPKTTTTVSRTPAPGSRCCADSPPSGR